MKEDNGSFIDALKGVLFIIGLFLALPASVFMIVFGSVKSAEFRNTEKVTVTFTEPSSSVTLRSEYRKTGDYDRNDEPKEERVYYYEIKVPYTYAGKQYVYRVKKDRSADDAPKVGDLYTFTQTFTPEGELIWDYGSLLFMIGVILAFLSTPVVFFLVRERQKERKENKGKDGGKKERKRRPVIR
ncbi:MAG: hypothetical protein IJK02_01105 [Clostridia bacterium]|nr:hypothetical protein [Clostridia bacterium]